MRKFIMFAAAAAAMVAAVPASATTFIYKMTEIGGNGEHYRFTLDSNPTVANFAVLGSLVGKTMISGSTAGDGNNYVLFGYLTGLQIRTGTNAGSTVVGALLGSHLADVNGSKLNLKTGNFLVGGASGAFALNVAPVPEPATWGMMVLGFGALGFAVRARRGKSDALTA